MSNLSSKAMLVFLKVSQWTARKYDKKATAEVAQNHNVSSEEVGRFNKQLIDVKSLKIISKLVNKIRSYHYDNTLPWDDAGSRILPSANYTDYSQKMREFKTEFDTAVNEFNQNYHSLVDDARNRLNGLFNERDYPADVTGRFGIDVSVMPLPDATGFRVNIADDEAQQIRDDIEQRAGAATSKAMGDLWKRVYDAVSHMQKKLADADAVFRNSLVENLIGLVELLPKLNITDDPKLTEMTTEIKKNLIQVDPAALREDDVVRQETADKAQELLDKMAGFLGDVTVPVK